MVDVVSRRCLRDGCTRVPSFNVKGRKPALYCMQHASGGMVNTVRKRRSNEPGKKRQKINSEGGCKGDSLATRCSHTSCVGQSSWGTLTDGAATVCGRHKGDILGTPVVNFRARCKVARCGKLSSWGLGGEQPTHCPDHGPLVDGFLCTVAVGKTHSTGAPSDLFDGAVTRPSSSVKTECLF